MPLSERAARLPDIVSAHFTRLGVRDTFGSYGLKPEQVDEFAQVVWTSFNQDLACHPKPIRDQQEVAEIVRQCL
ncbi:hypothetical protein D3C75_1031760 [compost metagenome]